jgi:hypothetical protein
MVLITSGNVESLVSTRSMALDKLSMADAMLSRPFKIESALFVVSVFGSAALSAFALWRAISSINSPLSTPSVTYQASISTALSPSVHTKSPTCRAFCRIMLHTSFAFFVCTNTAHSGLNTSEFNLLIAADSGSNTTSFAIITPSQIRPVGPGKQPGVLPPPPYNWLNMHAPEARASAGIGIFFAPTSIQCGKLKMYPKSLATAFPKEDK